MTSVPLRFSRMLTALVAATLLVTLLPAAHAAADNREAHVIRQRMEYLVNRTRARHNLGRLRVSDLTHDYARAHALQMRDARTIFHDANLAHEIPRGSVAWGENVGYTNAHRAAKRLHRLFMASSGHRANILSSRYTRLGFGVAKDGDTAYVVERFFDR
ncbi:MAG: CAP domain-containing protein [Euzebyales bacterium]|nr:CAP domain-containing protein [Euzebyales bacterium]